MQFFSVIPFLLASLPGVFPLPQRHSTTSLTSRPYNVQSQNGNSGTVTTCHEPNFQGPCSTVDVMNQCSGNFPSGTIKSVKQQQGAVCFYFRDFDCAAGNHSPSKRVDSKTAAFEWASMGDWEGKVLSFKCSLALL